jgi:hypothetical protein
VDFDARTGKLVKPDKSVSSLWSREYRRGWEPKV